MILGIDPGLDGALAWIEDDGALACVEDMPALELSRGGKAKREVDKYALARMIDDHIPSVVFIERVGSMPGQGVSSVFAFGRVTGMLIGICAATFAPIHELSPVAWRRAVGIARGAGKDASRDVAITRWPQETFFGRKRDHNRAEAALIALGGKILRSNGKL